MPECSKIVRRQLEDACFSGDLSVVKRLVQQGVDVNIVLNDRGETPLFVAAGKGHSALFTYLIKQGATIHTLGLLHEACWGGNVGIVRFLIENGHAVNARDASGDTPLLSACRVGVRLGQMAFPGYNFAVIKLLVENGADVNMATQQDLTTPLHLLCSSSRSDAARYLIDHGAEVNAMDDKGNTALRYACRERNKPLIEYLLKKGAHASDAADCDDNQK